MHIFALILTTVLLFYALFFFFFFFFFFFIGLPIPVFVQLSTWISQPDVRFLSKYMHAFNLYSVPNTLNRCYFITPSFFYVINLPRNGPTQGLYHVPLGYGAPRRP